MKNAHLVELFLGAAAFALMGCSDPDEGKAAQKKEVEVNRLLITGMDPVEAAKQIDARATKTPFETFYKVRSAPLIPFETFEVCARYAVNNQEDKAECIGKKGAVLTVECVHPDNDFDKPLKCFVRPHSF